MQLPERISRLEELAHNLWWSWSPEARAVFRSISLRLWRSTDHNPVRMLNLVTPDRMDRLAADPDFLKEYDELMGLFDNAMTAVCDASGNPTAPANVCTSKIAYFAAEYGLHSSLRIYSGGLGIL